MPRIHLSPRSSSVNRVVVQAVIACLMPLGTAFAQSIPLVRVTDERVEIKESQYSKGKVLMTAPRETRLEVIHTDGDRFNHQRSNWYWVLLPRDPWGTRRAGWVSGNDVEPAPPAEAVKATPAAQTGMVDVGRAPQARNEQSKVSVVVDAEPRRATPVEAPKAAPAPLPFSEVVLNFEFGKSHLTDEAKHKLASAVSLLKASPQGVSFALEGHADSIGTEPYNEKLGLARAETVRRQLAEQHQIPVEKISVATYGEHKPAASNATQDGRAENRRVVVKVGL